MLDTALESADQAGEAPRTGPVEPTEGHIEPNEKAGSDEGFTKVTRRRRRTKEVKEGTAALDGSGWRLASARPPRALWISGLDRRVAPEEQQKFLECKGVHPTKVLKPRTVRGGTSGTCAFHASFDDADFAKCNRREFFPAGVRFRKWVAYEPDGKIVVW